MKKCQIKTLTAAVLLASATQAPLALADTFTEALTGGEASGVLRLRYEDVAQDNALKDASALTLRSVFQYKTGMFNGFSATAQFEDVRAVAGMNDYSVPPTGFNTGIYSVIADPQSTEVNQGFLQYASGSLGAKVGRQVINYDNQRFIGAVGWRQDWQVFDAFTGSYSLTEALDVSYNYIGQRKRLFADAADVSSDDHLFHASYDSALGKIGAYAYLLEEDTISSKTYDTYGLRLAGSGKMGDLKANYLLEFATQEYEVPSTSAEADYFHLVGGMSFAGIAGKLGYEVLGSDSGSYGFSTPLATAHAFNGWADIFLGTPNVGLEDFYIDLSGKVLGGSWKAVFHDYSADESSSVLDDLGSEVNLQFTKALSSNYTVGVKYADYSAGDAALGKPDTQKFWVWFQASF